MPPWPTRRKAPPWWCWAARNTAPGSSRDWAAKGTKLLGVRAVICRILRADPPQQPGGHGRAAAGVQGRRKHASLGLDGSETFTIRGIADIAPRKVLEVQAVKPDGAAIDFKVMARLDTDVDVDYFHNGGILPYVLRKLTQ